MLNAGGSHTVPFFIKMRLKKGRNMEKKAQIEENLTGVRAIYSKGELVYDSRDTEREGRTSGLQETTKQQ